MSLNDAAIVSANRYEYLHDKNSVNFTTSGGTPNTATVVIPHTLGYAPFYILSFRFDDSDKYYRAFNGPGLLLIINGKYWQIGTLTISANQITAVITMLSDTAVHTGRASYRIYKEEQI